MKHQRKIAVLVSTSHPVFLDGLKVILGSHPQIRVLADAKGLSEAVTKTLDLRPDVLLLDIAPADSGVAAAIRRMKQEHHQLKIIVLSLADGTVTREINTKAAALLQPRSSMTELLDMIYAAGSASLTAPPLHSAAANRSRTPRLKSRSETRKVA